MRKVKVANNPYSIICLYELFFTPGAEGCKKNQMFSLKIPGLYFKCLFFVFISKDVPCFSQEAEIIPEMQQLQNVEGLPSLISEALWRNGEDQHTEQTLLKMSTVKLVDFRKTRGLNAKIISEGNCHTGGNYD